MIEFFAGLLALGFGFGLACWICGKALNKSNNLGDSHANSSAYNVDTTFTHSCNNMSRSEGLAFFDMYAYKYNVSDAVDEKEKVRRMTDEERKKNRKAPTGAFVSRNTDGYTAGRDEEPDWVKRADRGQW